jgi:hypothetical protein
VIEVLLKGIAVGTREYEAPSVSEIGLVRDLTMQVKDVGATDGFTNNQGQDIGTSTY